MSVRNPWVAGTFYPSDPNRLMQSIEDSFNHKLGPGGPPKKRLDKRKTISVICPHAGYMYSGPVAAHGYYSLAQEPNPKSIIIIGTNHSGLGSAIALMNRGTWRTPLGGVKIDEGLANAILQNTDLIDVDELAHLREHSIEVQLPFLQFIYGTDISFVPIGMGFQDLESSREVGRAIAEACSGKDVAIIASTDLTHYESQSSAKKKDEMVIKAVLALNEAELQDAVHRNRISMCGLGPVSASLVASKLLGATRAELLAHHTSGDVSGDYSAVVGYASMKIEW